MTKIHTIKPHRTPSIGLMTPSHKKRYLFTDNTQCSCAILRMDVFRQDSHYLTLIEFFI